MSKHLVVMPTHFKGTEDERRALDSFIKLTRAAESVSVRINANLHRHHLTVSQFGCPGSFVSPGASAAG